MQLIDPTSPVMFPSYRVPAAITSTRGRASFLIFEGSWNQGFHRDLSALFKLAEKCQDLDENKSEAPGFVRLARLRRS